MEQQATTLKSPSADAIRKIQKQRWIFFVLVLVVLSAGVFAMTHLDDWVEKSDLVADLDGNAGNYSGKQESAHGGIAVPGYPSITLPANQKQVQVAFLNPEGNACYFTFELVLMNNGVEGESIYKSKMVAPGKIIKEADLKRELDAGAYAARIKITTNSLEGLQPMSNANVDTKLIVK